MTHPSTTQLDAQLHDLHLGAVLEEYRAQAEAAAHAGWPYTAYLAALIQQETDRRLRNRLQRRIKDAHFPLHKELADFDFEAIPQLDRRRIMTLAQGAYLPQAESVLMVGNPGLGKPQPIHYPYRCDVCSRTDGHSRRSASPSVWSDASLGGHHTETESGPLLRGLDSPSC